MKRFVLVLWMVLGIGVAVQGIALGFSTLPLADSARISITPFLPGPSDEILVTISGTYYGGPPDAYAGWADAKIDGGEIRLDVYWHPHPDTASVAGAYPPYTGWSFEDTVSLGTLNPGTYRLYVRNHGLVDCSASTLFGVRSGLAWWPSFRGSLPW